MLKPKMYMSVFQPKYIAAILMTALIIMLPVAAYAQNIPDGCPGSPVAGPPLPGSCEKDASGCYKNPKPEVIQRCDDQAATCNPADQNNRQCSVYAYINDGINFLAIGVGVVVTIMIIIGGIQYSMSGGNPQAAAAAKSKITNAILALVAFALLFGFMQWIIPGGL